jgi:hypothetical protein
MPFIKNLSAIASLAPALCPLKSTFFEALKSKHRLSLLAETHHKLCQTTDVVLPDALACFPSLDGFDVYAADGHFHQHAVHDAANSKGCRQPAGHLYILNLRNGMLSHLTVLGQIEQKSTICERSNARPTPISPSSSLRQGYDRQAGPLMSSFNGLDPKSKFLAIAVSIGPAPPPRCYAPAPTKLGRKRGRCRKIASSGKNSLLGSRGTAYLSSR